MDDRYAERSRDTHRTHSEADIDRVLDAFVPRFRRHFPTLRDEALIAEIVERTRRRIIRRQGRSGPIANLHAYAWVTLHHVAATWRRSGPGKLEQRIRCASTDRLLDRVSAPFGTVEQVERRILLRELFATLTPKERVLCRWKAAGFSSAEIAAWRRTSPRAIESLLSRVRAKLRAFVDRESEPALRFVGAADRRVSSAHVTVSHGQSLRRPSRKLRSSLDRPDQPSVVRAIASHPLPVSSPPARPDGSPPADSPAASRFA